MDFSIIVPSRNRPHLVRAAVASVLAQSHASCEVILVDDGSDHACLAAYDAIAAEFLARLRLVRLERTPRGHGPSYAVNRGAEVATGRFIGFLDDDDVWTDPQHLARALSAFHADDGTVDLYFANQQAFDVEDRPIDAGLWLNSLPERLSGQPALERPAAHRISVSELLLCPGFCHLNTTLVRRELFNRIGGMDESIRYECEWDLYLRMLAAAHGILYFPGYVSRHNAPDPSKTRNVSTAMTYLQKMLFRNYVMDKALLFSGHPDIRRRAARIKSDSLKDVARHLAREQQYRSSATYAWAALPSSASLSWLAFCLLAELRRRCLSDAAATNAAAPPGNGPATPGKVEHITEALK